jgi:hypothetical protein
MRMKALMTRVRKAARSKKTSKYAKPIAVSAVAFIVSVMVGAALLMAARESAKPAPQPTAEHKTMAAVTDLSREPNPLASPSNAKTAAAGYAPVTITGCLERHDEDFRLKDAAGGAVSKSRSWKSGFLKKSTPSIDVVDATHKLKLADHVGERISVTGMLDDREMQARTLKRVASDCNVFK